MKKRKIQDIKLRKNKKDTGIMDIVSFIAGIVVIILAYVILTVS